MCDCFFHNVLIHIYFIIVVVSLSQIFDKFLPRLQDPNSKVNLYALQVMLQITPILADALVSVINIAVGNVSPNLSSKNKEIYQSAMDIIDAFMDNIGMCFLLWESCWWDILFYRWYFCISTSTLFGIHFCISTSTEHISRLHAGLCSTHLNFGAKSAEKTVISMQNTHMFFHQIDVGYCHLETKVELDMLPLNRHARLLH